MSARRSSASVRRSISFDRGGKSSAFRTSPSRSFVGGVHVRKPLDERRRADQATSKPLRNWIKTRSMKHHRIKQPAQPASLELDHEACYRAVCQRDARFDGRFFGGVKTTGIYCRPVCPARVPLSKNVIFFPTAAAAQEAGFRPCLRCRPETAPDLGAWRGTSNTVSRALGLIELGALDQADVAFAAGFGSIRRFNETFHALFGRAPRDLRRAKGPDVSAGPRGEIELLLRYHPPYDWQSVLEFLRRRAIPGIEVVTADRYARSVQLDGIK